MAEPSLSAMDGERCEECYRDATRIVIYEALDGSDMCAVYVCERAVCLVNRDAWLGELWRRVDITDSDATGEK
jgi:hypothetical protein